MSILNPETWKTDQEELKKWFSSQLNEKDKKEIQIIVNTADDKYLLNSIALQHDYIALSEDSEDSSNSSSENSDYSL